MGKTIIISEEQIKKVRQGLITYEENKPDYEIGFEGTPPSDYAHVIENKIPVTLNEENRTQKRKCVEVISNYSSHYVTPYLNDKLVDIPNWLKPSMAPNSTLFKSVANNQNGCDKLIDFLRLNLYQQFGVNRNSNLTFFIPGIARIACKDLGYYSFSPIEMKGGCIIKFARLLKLIDRKEGFMKSTGIVFNEDFNNMSYYDMMNVFEPKIKEYIETTFSGLEAEENKPVKVSDYTIYPISDYIDGGMLRPDREGKKILNHFARYTDWCVCAHENAEFEYAQYLSNGGKMYICAKDGFEKIQRPETTMSPLDEYGLSLINVIVAEDGLPDNVTTRYNHDFGGENHSELWEALHLQKVLDVNYKEIFKPRSKEELHAMNINESRLIRENQNDKKANDYLKNVVGITDFEKIRKFIMNIYEAIPNSRLMRGYYLLGIVRLIHENGNKFKATQMNNILYNMKKQEVYMDRNLNDMTYDELVEKFYVPEEIQEVDGVQKIRKVANGYTIRHVETFDEMRMVCDGEWCISYADDIWYELVEENHECVYVVENQEMIKSINMNSEEWYETSEMMSDPYDSSEFGEYGSGKAPYDTYGLSRFVVLIHPSYTSVYSRWNIPNCLDGDFLSNEQLENLLGLPFNEAFPYIKPIEYNEDELFENKQIVTESLEPEEVDLSSFEIKDKLNPKFWKDKKIDSRIRLKLLDIADDYVDSLNINWAEPEDITMTGSLANFTWNEEYSDIDLHIIIDYKKVDERTDFVRNYLDAKEKDWRNKHENLKIYGFPIEVYVQDKNEKHAASGIYSLEKNEWILEPNKDNFNENDYEDEVVKNKVSEYTKKIDKLLEDFEEKTTESDIETIYNKSISLFNKIKDERNDELHAKDAKELSNGNLIFKSLRRNGYIEKLINLRNNSYDKWNSLN